MTIREAAATLGISASKVRSLCRARQIEHYRYGSRVVIEPEQLETYRNACLVVSARTENEARWMDYLSSPKSRLGARK